MKLIMPLLAALLAANLTAQALEASTEVVQPVLSISSRAGSDVDIAPANPLPTAMDDAYYLAPREAISVPAPGVLANDTGESLLAMLPEQTNDLMHGTLELLKDGGFNYQPLADFVGEDVFTYQAMDIYGNVVTAQIHFYCGSATDVLVLAGTAPMPDGGAEEAASCSAARGSAPWMLLPVVGLALMRLRRARA